MVYKLVLGDWSKDGHKQSEDFYLIVITMYTKSDKHIKTTAKN